MLKPSPTKLKTPNKSGVWWVWWVGRVLSLPFGAWVLEGPQSTNQGVVLPSDLPLA